MEEPTLDQIEAAMVYYGLLHMQDAIEKLKENKLNQKQNKTSMKNLAEVTTTKSGYAVKNLKWNSIANKIIGLVNDPIWSSPERPFVTATWHKNGKCVNRTREELDLDLK